MKHKPWENTDKMEMKNSLKRGFRRGITSFNRMRSRSCPCVWYSEPLAPHLGKIYDAGWRFKQSHSDEAGNDIGLFNIRTTRDSVRHPKKRSPSRAKKQAN